MSATHRAKTLAQRVGRMKYLARRAPIGIEITASSQLTSTLNRVRKELRAAPVRRADFSPLRAA